MSGGEPGAANEESAQDSEQEEEKDQDDRADSLLGLQEAGVSLTLLEDMRNDTGHPLWHLMLGLLVLLVLCAVGAMVGCKASRDPVCLQVVIPRMQAMLVNRISAPYITAAFTVAMVLHGCANAAVNEVAGDGSRTARRLGFLLSGMLYGTMFLGLMVFPYMDYSSFNVGLVLAALTLLGWMGLTLGRFFFTPWLLEHHRKRLALALGVLVAYAILCVLYVVLQAVPVDRLHPMVVIVEFFMATSLVLYACALVPMWSGVRFQLFQFSEIEL